MTNSVKNHSAMKTEESERALRIIMETGKDQSNAIRWALTIAANLLEHAWVRGHEDRGTIPQMKVYYRNPAKH